MGFDGKHQPLQCGFPYYGSYHPQEVTKLVDLPSQIQVLLKQHITARVGAKVYQDITFDRGQVVDLKQLRRIEPESKHFKWRVPAYNLLYQLRLPGREIFLACVLLDGDGGIIQELSLPAWGLVEIPGPLMSLAEATEVAKKLGVPDSSRAAELKYFPDTDTLEWLFSEKTHDDGLQFGGKTLHVPLQDPAGTHWSTWIGIR